MTMAEKIARAKADIDAVYGAGRELEHSRMWDKLQTNGEQTDYATGYGYFSGRLFSAENFYPKYDIKPVGSADYLFYSWEARKNHTNVLDLKQRLIDCGVVLDTSKATSISMMFAYSAYIDNIPTIDCSSATGTVQNLFSNSWALRKTIEKVIVNENIVFQDWFYGATGLETVIFEGTIGQNGLNMSDCTRLDKASITSIINCLSTTTSGKSVTLSKTAVNNAFTTAEWTALANTRTNWTISLV